MPRKFYKKYSRGSRDKYSVEQQAGSLNIPANSQAWSTVVPDTAIQGMRKIKHLTISLAADEVAGQAGPWSYWCLVYVPQGTAVNTMNLTGTSGMYEPNQFVMNCGVADFSAGPCRISSRLSRNLNSGDKICLIMSNPVADRAAHFEYVVRYAVTLQ